MTPDFSSNLQKWADEAPEAGFAAVNFGRLTVVARGVSWSADADGVRTPTKRELTGDATLADKETLELEFTVHISELNPALEFDYTRNVTVKKSGREKSDWDEIIRPSLEHVFGKNWAKAILASPYVCVEDVNNVANKASKTTGKVYGVPKFIGKYANLNECLAGREQRFGKADGGASNGGLPADVVTQVKGLLTSMGGNEAMVIQMLNAKPFGDYDPQTLLEAAKK